MTDLATRIQESLAVLLAAALPLVGSACAKQAGVTAEASLLPLPVVDLGHLDEEGVRALESARAEVEETTAGDAASLAVAYGQLGMLYQAHSLPEPAEVCYQNAALLAPEEFRWPYYLGHLYRTARDHARSLESFETALALEPRYPALLFHLGNLHLEQHRLEEARKLLEHALELEGDSAAMHFGMGRLLIAEGKPEAAVEHLEAALRLAPDATRTHYLLGLAHRDLGQSSRAQEHLDRAGVVKPNPEDGLMAAVRRLEDPRLQQRLRGVIALQEGRWSDAAEELRRAAEEHPEDPVIRLNLGMALATLGKLEEAEAELLESLRLGNGGRMRLTAHLNLGKLYTLKGSGDEATAHFRAALEIDPGHLQARSDLGRSLFRLGRLEEAEGVFRKLLELDPERPDAYLGLSMTLKGLGRLAAARDLLEEGHALLGGEARIAGALTELLATCPDPTVRDGARALELARTLWQNARTPPNATILALALAEQGDFEKAIALQRAAIDRAAQAGQENLAARWRVNLRAFERNEPVRLPTRAAASPK